MIKRRISVAIVLLYLSATAIASSAEEVNEETGEMIVNLKGERKSGKALFSLISAVIFVR